jgi:probable addiction module antidote protein
MKDLTDFKVENYLDDEDDVAAYLDAALREADDIEDDQEASDYFLAALGDAARAERKMTSIARRANVGREGIYRSLSPNANPSFRTVVAAIRELGGRLSISPAN